MSAPVTDNTNNIDSNNIIFTIKDSKLYLPVVNLSARGNQKLSKLLSKECETSLYWNEYKTKGENWNTTNEVKYFLKSNFVQFNRLFALVHTNEDAASKRFKAKRYYLKKGNINNYDVIINGKNFYDQQIDSDIKWYRKIKELATGQGEDYTTERLLDYEYINNQYRLIVVNLLRQRELDADPKTI